MKGTNGDSTTPVSHDSAEHDIEHVSKSQLKRDSKALQDLGKKLCMLNADQLARIPLNNQLTDAIVLAHKLVNKRGALKRHYQYIGKLLRSIDAEPIIMAVQEIEAAQSGSVQAFKRLEQWRDRILQEGDTAIQDFCIEHEQADRQQLRQIFRNYKQARDERKQAHVARMLFRTLREMS